MVIERRYSSGAVSLASSASTVTAKGNKVAGKAAVFDVRSLELQDKSGPFVEIIKAGALDGCLLDDVVAVYNHDEDKVLARSRKGVGTLRLSVDKSALSYEFNADPEQSFARDLIVSLRRGDIDGSSFAFNVAPGGDTWVREKDGTRVRTIHKIARLYDVSVVTRPAYGAAATADVRLGDFRISGERAARFGLPPLRESPSAPAPRSMICRPVHSGTRPWM